jgi:hypothetical protein
MQRLTRTYSEQPKFKGVIYARSGAGKTTLAATCAYHEDLREVCFLDKDGGLMSVIEGLDDLEDEHLPFAQPVRAVDDGIEFFWKLKRREGEYKNIRTVVLDTGSELFNAELEETTGKAIKEQQSRKGGTLDDPQPADYGKAGKRVSRLIRWFKDLQDVNLIVLAHTDEIWDKKSNDKFKKVAEEDKVLREVNIGISPMTRRLITGFVDFVWYLHVDGEGKRHLLTQRRGPYYAKTRGSLFAHRIGETIQWDEGDPLMARVYESLVNKTPLSPGVGSEEK